MSFRKAQQTDLPQVLAFERRYIEEIEPEHLDRWILSEANARSQFENSLDGAFTTEVRTS